MPLVNACCQSQDSLPIIAGLGSWDHGLLGWDTRLGLATRAGLPGSEQANRSLGTEFTKPPNSPLLINQFALRGRGINHSHRNT